MRTNIVLDDNLVKEAFRHAPVKTKRELVDLALRDFGAAGSGRGWGAVPVVANPAPSLARSRSRCRKGVTASRWTADRL